MKTLNMMYKTTFCILALLLTTQLFSQQYAERLLYRDTYSAKNISALKVLNKHGSIDIKNWDKDSIQISTDLYISASTTIKFDRLKKSIHIKYHKSDYDIVAQTTFSDSKLSFINDLQSLGNSITPSIEKQIEINYTVFLPKGIDIEINNQYGDISLGKIDNEIKINLANGSFKAFNLPQKAELTFSFVNAMLNDIKEVDFELKFSTVNINKAINLNFESRASELHVESVGVLKLKSARDKINIDNLDYIYGTANYTNCKIDNLNREMDGYFSYGQIAIDKVHSTTSIIKINSERTDIKIFVPKTISYNYDILYNTDASLQLPFKDFKTSDTNKGEDIKRTQGNYGANPTLNINIQVLKRCALQIMNISE